MRAAAQQDIQNDDRLSFLVIDYTPAGGVERVTSRLISLFRAHGIPVFSLLSVMRQHERPFIPFPEDLRIDVLCPQGAKAELGAQLSHYLRTQQIKTLIFQGDNMSIALQVQAAARQAGTRAIPIWHGSPYAYLRKYHYWRDIKARPWLLLRVLAAGLVWPFKKRKAARVIRQATAGLVCVSQGAEQEVRSLYRLRGESAKRITHIHNPLSLSSAHGAITPARKAKIVSYLARLERKHKNAQMVVEVWQRIAPRHPDWQLRILGDGSARAAMEAFVAAHQIPRVVFLGHVDQVAEELRASSIAMLTSHCEGINMGLVEAAEFGNALIAVDADGGVGDIVIDDQSGILVPKGQFETYVERLDQLMRDEKLRTRLGEGARARVRDFSDERIVKKWKHLLDERPPLA